jgi:hypothetical protein
MSGHNRLRGRNRRLATSQRPGRTTILGLSRSHTSKLSLIRKRNRGRNLDRRRSLDRSRISRPSRVRSLGQRNLNRARRLNREAVGCHSNRTMSARHSLIIMAIIRMENRRSRKTQ